MLRFIRVICHPACRAIWVHSAFPSSSAVSIWNGTSGTSLVALALYASKRCTISGSAAASWGLSIR